MRILVVVAALALAQAAEAVAPLASSRYAPLVVTDAAIPSARRLREVFDERFAAPRAAHEDRFAWDPRRAAQTLVIGRRFGPREFPRAGRGPAAGCHVEYSKEREADRRWDGRIGHGVSATRSPGMSTS